MIDIAVPTRTGPAHTVLTCIDSGTAAHGGCNGD